MISDDSSTDDFSDLDDGNNTSDDNDDSILELHKGAIVEYMLAVHRRKKTAIESYEAKRNVKYLKYSNSKKNNMKKQSRIYNHLLILILLFLID